MSWYAAHVIMFIELNDAVQDRYPVWEDIILVHAKSEDQAFRKAKKYGHSEEGDDDASLRWGKKPARWVFAGVRKLVECEDAFEATMDGAEVSYNELELDSREAVKKLASGKSATAVYNDHFRPTGKKSAREEGEPKHSKRL